MAAGKTTLGRPLALALGRTFVDTDQAVEALAGKSVSRIFAEEGEARFRQLESEVLRRAATDGAVVACGGGTPCREENIAFMLDAGLVVELKASLETTVRRLRLAPGQRPLVDALLDRPEELAAKVGEMEGRRRQWYDRAHATFDTNELETQAEVDAAVERFIRTFIP